MRKSIVLAMVSVILFGYAAMANAITEIYHQVTPGETVESIARHFKVPASVIKKENGIKKVTEGQMVRIPCKKEVKVAKKKHVHKKYASRKSVERRVGSNAYTTSTTPTSGYGLGQGSFPVTNNPETSSANYKLNAAATSNPAAAQPVNNVATAPEVSAERSVVAEKAPVPAEAKSTDEPVAELVAAKEEAAPAQTDKAKEASAAEETESDLIKAFNKGMTASSDLHYTPEAGSKMPQYSLFGKSFNELAATAGVGHNLGSPSYFYYGLLEGVHWLEVKNAGRNVGIGGKVLLDGWEGKDKFYSSAVALLAQLGWYEVFGKTESTHLLLKPQVGVKIHLDHSKDKVNPIIGLYGELDHKTSVESRLLLTVDFMDELKKLKEGYFVARVGYEYTFESKKRLLVGVGPVNHFNGDEHNWGPSPVVSLRIPFDRNNALTMGVIGDFTGGKRNSVGVFATYSWDDIRYRKKGGK